MTIVLSIILIFAATSTSTFVMLAIAARRAPLLECEFDAELRRLLERAEQARQLAQRVAL